MLEVVHRRDVVPVFMNIHGAVEGDPSTRFVVRMDLVALYLPRADACEGVIVVTELEITNDPQSIHGAGCKAQQASLLADSRDVARRIVARRGAGKGQG